MSDEEIIERIRMKFRRKVLKDGPSIITGGGSNNSRFLEQMMTLCNFSRISNKIQGGINKYQRTFRLRNKSMSVNNSPLIQEKDNEDENEEEINKSSFFITQAFLPLPSKSGNITPTLRTHKKNFQSLDTTNQSSPNITSYLNFLSSNIRS